MSVMKKREMPLYPKALASFVEVAVAMESVASVIRRIVETCILLEYRVARSRMDKLWMDFRFFGRS